MYMMVMMLINTQIIIKMPFFGFFASVKIQGKYTCLCMQVTRTFLSRKQKINNYKYARENMYNNNIDHFTNIIHKCCRITHDVYNERCSIVSCYRNLRSECETHYKLAIFNIFFCISINKIYYTDGILRC